MGNEFITFGEIVVEKYTFPKRKSPSSIYYVNIHRRVVSNNIPFCKNMF